MRKLWIAVIGIIFSTALLADVVTLKPGVPERYVVKKGDTLWDISQMFLDDPWLWPDIWHINPQINNPHLIYPGDIIGLVMIDGQVKITTISRGDTGTEVQVTPEGNVMEEISPGLVKLKPTARVTPIFGAIPAIPREHIEGFLSGNRIVTEDQLKQSPYIIGGFEGRIVLGAGDKVYARGDFENAVPAYEVYRQGQMYLDPITEEFLGIEAINLGLAQYDKLSGEVATLNLSRTVQNVRVADRLMSTNDDALVNTYFPSSPADGTQGYILSVLRGVSSIGQYDVVVLNLGEREGLEPGNILNIWRRGELVDDPVAKELVRLPAEKAGLLMVFRTFEKLAYGLVLDASRPMSVGDEVREPGIK